MVCKATNATLARRERIRRAQLQLIHKICSRREKDVDAIKVKQMRAGTRAPEAWRDATLKLFCNFYQILETLPKCCAMSTFIS